MENESSQQKTNKKYKRLLVVLLVVIALIMACVITVWAIGKPYDRTHNTYTKVVVKKGDSTADIAEELEKKGIIGNASDFVFLSRIKMYNGKYQAGTYFLSSCMSMSSISNTIMNGISTSTGFELPAGLTVEQTAKALEQAGFVDKDVFLKMASDVDFSIFDFIDEDVQGPEKLEGYLLPGKYDMSTDANEAMIITTMLNQFGNYFTEECRSRARSLGYSTRDILIIASMIEKETTIDKERTAISAVIHNKLSKGIEFKDGFPDAPLCSPGIESINAALYPDESDNIYYVLSDKLNGSHVFTSDRNEYRELKEKYDAAMKEKSTEKEAE